MLPLAEYFWLFIQKYCELISSMGMSVESCATFGNAMGYNMLWQTFTIFQLQSSMYLTSFQPSARSNLPSSAPLPACLCNEGSWSAYISICYVLSVRYCAIPYRVNLRRVSLLWNSDQRCWWMSNNRMLACLHSPGVRKISLTSCAFRFACYFVCGNLLTML